MSTENKQEHECFHTYHTVLFNISNYIDILKEMKCARTTKPHEKYELHCEIIRHFIEIFDLSLYFLPYAYYKYPETTANILQALKNRHSEWENQIYSMNPEPKDRKLYMKIFHLLDDIKTMCGYLLNTDTSKQYIANTFNQMLDRQGSPQSEAERQTVVSSGQQQN